MQLYVSCLRCSVYFRIKINENTSAHILTSEEIKVERNIPRIFYINPNFQKDTETNNY